jgi:hypothetical protein
MVHVQPTEKAGKERDEYPLEQDKRRRLVRRVERERKK